MINKTTIKNMLKAAGYDPDALEDNAVSKDIKPIIKFYQTIQGQDLTPDQQRELIGLLHAVSTSTQTESKFVNNPYYDEILIELVSKFCQGALELDYRQKEQLLKLATKSPGCYSMIPSNIFILFREVVTLAKLQVLYLTLTPMPNAKIWMQLFSTLPLIEQIINENPDRVKGQVYSLGDILDAVEEWLHRRRTQDYYLFPKNFPPRETLIMQQELSRPLDGDENSLLQHIESLRGLFLGQGGKEYFDGRCFAMVKPMVQNIFDVKNIISHLIEQLRKYVQGNTDKKNIVYKLSKMFVNRKLQTDEKILANELLEMLSSIDLRNSQSALKQLADIMNFAFLRISILRQSYPQRHNSQWLLHNAGELDAILNTAYEELVQVLARENMRDYIATIRDVRDSNNKNYNTLEEIGSDRDNYLKRAAWLKEQIDAAKPSAPSVDDDEDMLHSETDEEENMEPFYELLTLYEEVPTSSEIEWITSKDPMLYKMLNSANLHSLREAVKIPDDASAPPADEEEFTFSEPGDTSKLMLRT
jgi:hypothetical protein